MTCWFPLATFDSLVEELERVDRALDRADEGLIIDHTQYLAHVARLRTTRRQVLERLAALSAGAAA